MKSPSSPATQSIDLFRGAVLFPALLLLVLASTIAASAQAPAPDSPAIEAKAHAWLDKLTLDEKVELVGGEDSMYTHPAPAIGLPRFKMSDASVGVRTWGPTTAYAGGVALAATWDPEFAAQAGRVAGQGCARPRRQLPARPRRQHCPLAHRRAQLRVSVGRSLSQRNAGRPVHPGRAVSGRDRHGQALRAQQSGVQPPQCVLRRRRAHHARDLSARRLKPR